MNWILTPNLIGRLPYLRGFTTLRTCRHADSNRTGFTAPDGSTNTYTYDTLNRLSTLANSWAGSFGFSYDALSRRTQMTRPNGIATNYSYDKLSHLLSVLHQAGTSTIDGDAYTLDAAGNRTAKTDYLAGVTSNYSYDKIYELTQVMQGTNTTETYSYDPVGNRLSSLGVASYSYNNSNELSSSSSGSYTYDANGNTLTDAAGRSYVWDFENRLKQVTLPNSGGTVTFLYDPFGRRIQKVYTTGANPPTTTTTNYLYDGDNEIEIVDQNGNPFSKFAQQEDIDAPLAESVGGATYDYEQDGSDSVTSLTSSTAALSLAYTYDSFGKITNSQGSVSNPFRYTGRDFDSESGLYYYRARYYDPTNGRFVSEDPLTFSGDGPDFYAYTLNDPSSWVDPMGTSVLCPVFLPWCPSDIPPAPPLPAPPGLPQFFKYNKPAPITGPLGGPALDLARCIGLHLGVPFVVTGGSECTPDGRHVPGGVLGSKHCTNQAFDMRPAGLDPKKVFCAAAKCGAKYIQDEGDHWHFQTTPGKHGGRGLVPKPCDCQ